MNMIKVPTSIGDKGEIIVPAQVNSQMEQHQYYTKQLVYHSAITVFIGNLQCRNMSHL